MRPLAWLLVCAMTIPLTAHAQTSKAKPATRAALPATSTPAGLGPIPPVPLAPPPPAVIPPDDAPPHPTSPPPLPPVDKHAPGSASTITGGLRLTFGSGGATLNPGDATALRALAQTGKGSTSIVYTIAAHAPGTEEDTSTPRRLSLERALAVRSVLINAGIASPRIYVRALGAMGLPDGSPADRVDITLATLDDGKPASPAPPSGNMSAP